MTTALLQSATRRWVPRPPSLGAVGALLVGAFAVVAAAAPWLSPYRDTELAGHPLEAPSAAHLLGTNGVGQDLFSQLLSGARLSLTIAVVAGVGTLVLGATVGLTAGWFAGRADRVLMRVVDLVLAIPRLPLLIVVSAYAGRGVITIALVISLTSWPPGARVIRSEVLSLRERTYLRSAVGFGAGAGHVLRRHVVPEMGLILIAGLVASAGRAIMIEAGLAFLGLGDPTRASWGQILREALDFNGLFFTDVWAWWLLPPVLAISLLLLGLTFIGLAVEERLNPRLARHPTGGRR